MFVNGVPLATFFFLIVPKTNFFIGWSLTVPDLIQDGCVVPLFESFYCLFILIF
jgi:hypothetical protein